MKQYFALLFVIIFTFTSHAQKNSKTSETSTYYFIRHAEKDRSDKTNRNPHLTEVGKKRAEHWSQVFTNVKFDVVYSTDYNRTKETAQPTATKNNLELTLYSPRKLDGKSFTYDNKGKTVLIVGHRNTTPMFVNALLDEKKYDYIDDNNSGNLYIVTVIDGKISDQVLTIN